VVIHLMKTETWKMLADSIIGSNPTHQIRHRKDAMTLYRRSPAGEAMAADGGRERVRGLVALREMERSRRRGGGSPSSRITAYQLTWVSALI